MIAALALLAGLVAGILLEPTVPVALQPYLPIAVVAALDAVFGGIRAKLDGVFDDKQFVISFVSTGNRGVAASRVSVGTTSTSCPRSSPPSRPSWAQDARLLGTA